MIKFEYLNDDGLVIHCDQLLSYEVSMKLRDAAGVDRVVHFNKYSIIFKMAVLCDKQETEDGLKNILREENYLD
jgi:hypothetical protein